MKGYFYSDFNFIPCNEWFNFINYELYGCKIKKFPIEKKVTDYIKKDLDSIYSAIELDSFNKETSLSNPLNTPIDIKDFKI